MSGRLTIVRPGLPLPEAQPGELVVPFDEFRDWTKDGRVLAHLAAAPEGRLLVHRLESAGRPLPLGLALRAMSRGRVWVEDVARPAADADRAACWRGGRGQAGDRAVSRLGPAPARGARGGRRRAGRQHAATAVARPLAVAALPANRSELRRARRRIGRPHRRRRQRRSTPLPALPSCSRPTMCRPLKPDVEVHQVDAERGVLEFQGAADVRAERRAATPRPTRALGGRQPAFVYQRYSLNNYSGIRVARRHGVPLVLEYNGSEIWMGRHWGRPLKYEALSERIEQLNLRVADLIVVVSRAHARRGRGARRRCRGSARQPERRRSRSLSTGRRRARRSRALRPRAIRSSSASSARSGRGTAPRCWRARSCSCCHDDPARADRVRLLMIGDGAGMPAVRQILSDGGAAESAVLTGLVPQEDGPEHLAACDMLASPHVPNPDGTPFFGSPTKLFEYMAMGKGIVASNLEQIGEVLEHGRTALARPARRRRRAGRRPRATDRRSGAAQPPRRGGTARGGRALHLARAHAPDDRAAAGDRRRCSADGPRAAARA